METRFKSQIEGVLTATQKLVNYTLLHSTTAEASDAILARLFEAPCRSFGKTRWIRWTRKESPEREGVPIQGVEGLEARTSASDSNSNWSMASVQTEGPSTP